MKILFFLTNIIKINFVHCITKKKIKKSFLSKIFNIKISIPGKSMNLKKHGVMGVLETNFGGVIFSEARLENFPEKNPSVTGRSTSVLIVEKG